jgi:hypothetical protein
MPVFERAKALVPCHDQLQEESGPGERSNGDHRRRGRAAHLDVGGTDTLPHAPRASLPAATLRRSALRRLRRRGAGAPLLAATPALGIYVGSRENFEAMNASSRSHCAEARHRPHVRLRGREGRIDRRDQAISSARSSSGSVARKARTACHGQNQSQPWVGPIENCLIRPRRTAACTSDRFENARQASPRFCFERTGPMLKITQLHQRIRAQNAAGQPKAHQPHGFVDAACSNQGFLKAAVIICLMLPHKGQFLLSRFCIVCNAAHWRQRVFIRP